MNAGQGSIASDFPIAAGTVPAGIAESGTGVVAGRIRLGINPLLAITNIDGNGFPVIFRNAGTATPFSVLNTTTLSQWNFQTDTDPLLQEWFGIVANQNIFCAADGSENTGAAQLQLRTSGQIMIGVATAFATLTVLNSISISDDGLANPVVLNLTGGGSIADIGITAGVASFISQGGNLNLGTNSLTQLYISPNRIGIFNPAPLQPVDIAGKVRIVETLTNRNTLIVANAAAPAGAAPGIQFVGATNIGEIFLSNAAGVPAVALANSFVVRSLSLPLFFTGVGAAGAGSALVFCTNGTTLAGNIVGTIDQAGNWILQNGVLNPASTGDKLQITGKIRTDQGVMTVAPVGWRLGNNKVAAAVLDATQYVEVELAGALVKLARIV